MQSLMSGWIPDHEAAFEAESAWTQAHRAKPVDPWGQGWMDTSPILVQDQLRPRDARGGQWSSRSMSAKKKNKSYEKLWGEGEVAL